MWHELWKWANILYMANWDTIHPAPSCMAYIISMQHNSELWKVGGSNPYASLHPISNVGEVPHGRIQGGGGGGPGGPDLPLFVHVVGFLTLDQQSWTLIGTPFFLLVDLRIRPPPPFQKSWIRPLPPPPPPAPSSHIAVPKLNYEGIPWSYQLAMVLSGITRRQHESAGRQRPTWFARLHSFNKPVNVRAASAGITLRHRTVMPGGTHSVISDIFRREAWPGTYDR